MSKNKKFFAPVIKGKGRGKKIGIPTINLAIPKGLDLKTGIYAVWVYISGKKYKGAMHYGPIPTFKEKQSSLEVYLLDVKSITADSTVELEIVEWIRKIKSFSSVNDLTMQIKQDIETIRKVLVYNHLHG
ncbi:MAG: Riboflavin biosynthesis protein RibF [Candidatus Roizmanbacteria bacterium GW2011_GWA2_36_23]|uniref:riboflavin kinase n=1 Tax=Candidatus Roizmanbacteria bacterium GW2011_GWA2_36_23 TaxID=1618480 RepID=A0A0G0E4F9_9BACT|nr:MAG: Riboflavin biosynthesis protein RibF [Candidatus Roizmanbacteria bacterium GW2011_GWA2_36_23]